MKPFGRREEETRVVELVTPSLRKTADPAIAVAAPVAGLQLQLRAKIMEQLDPAAISRMTAELCAPSWSRSFTRSRHRSGCN